MKKLPKKRLPHGVTQALVFDTLMRLSIEKTAVRAVGRAEIRQALSRLPETIIDDRLRILKALGRIVSTPDGYMPFIPMGAAPAAPKKSKRAGSPHQAPPAPAPAPKPAPVPTSQVKPATPAPKIPKAKEYFCFIQATGRPPL